MRKLIAAALLGLSTHALALEVEGVKLPDRTQVGQSSLLLNGAGLRSIHIGRIRGERCNGRSRNFDRYGNLRLRMA